VSRFAGLAPHAIADGPTAAVNIDDDAILSLRATPTRQRAWSRLAALLTGSAEARFLAG